MTFDQKKYEQVIIYLCSKLGGEIWGKKKLAKLLYFVDFDFFERYQKSITGESYKAFPMGPFPIKLEEVSRIMEKKKEITIENVQEREGYLPTEVYRCHVKPDVSIFNEQEKRMLNRIAIMYGQLNGKQLEDLSHAEAPYIGTEPNKEISYELSFYRGTNFNNL